MPPFRPIPAMLFLAALLAATDAAAATTRGSYDRPPYLHGRIQGPVRPAAHVAVRFRAEPGSLDLDPDRSPALAAVLDSLRVEIDRLGLTAELPVDVRIAGGPDVAFGCRRGGTAEDGTPLAPDEIDVREPRRMAFEVEGPSRNWRRLVRAAAGDRVRSVVSVQLGFAEHWVRQRDWKGSKAIELGAGRAMELPWLTSLDDPVQVLQLTGALVRPDGRITRVGAEGLIARRTGMAASVLGAQEVLTEDDLRALLEPGPGGEPVWRIALRRLIEGLLEGG